MKRLVIMLLAGLGLLAGCAKDNVAPPSSQLTGRITFRDQALNVRGGGNVQLELWQRSEFFRTKIPVYVAQDGTYSATLFDGDYKLTRLRDNGPWQNQTDSIDVKVRGNTTVDVPVQPYFTVGATAIAKAGNTFTVSTLVSKVGTRNIESVTLFVNSTQFVDNNNSLVGQVGKVAADLTNLSQPVALSFTIPSTARGTVYARVGVRTQGVNEMIYSSVQKINL